MHPIILIPAYKPDEKLLKLIDELTESGYENILLVDDGSGEEYSGIFEQAETHEQVEVIRHHVNLGKGRALKTGFNHIIGKYPGRGAITCDADGQHTVPSINDINDAMSKHPGQIVLGARKFVGAGNIPVTNFLGNTITRIVFFLLTGLSFGDTQSGLRAFPPEAMKFLMKVRGERYEFENTMLLAIRENHMDFVESTIETVYIGQNQSSHFDKLRDSYRIYSSILSFAGLAFLAALAAHVLFVISINIVEMCSLYRPVSIYAASLILGWLILSSGIKRGNSWVQFFSMLGAVALCSALYYLSYRYVVPSLYWAWWLAAIAAAPLFWGMNLRFRYGKKPEKTMYRKEE